MADNPKSGLLNLGSGTESPAGSAWSAMVGMHEGQHGHEPTAGEIAERLKIVALRKDSLLPLTPDDQAFLERHTPQP